MRAIVTADLHLTARSQDEYRWRFLSWLANLIDKEEATDLFILGDLTAKKDNHPSWLVNNLVKQLNEITSLECNIYILMGNHDYINPSMPFFNFLNQIPKINFVTNPQTLAEREGLRIRMVPHCADKTRMLELAQWPTDYLFLHETVSGARAINGAKLEGVSPAVIQAMKANHVISGHLHTPQKIGQVTYCGAPYPINFGDDFEPRVLLFDNLQIKSIPYKTIGKRKITLSKPEELIKQVEPGDQVDITVKLSKSEFVKWKEYKQEILDVGKEIPVHIFGVKLEEQVRLRIGQKTAPKKLDCRTPESLVKAFGSDRNIEKSIVDAGVKFVMK